MIHTFQVVEKVLGILCSIISVIEVTVRLQGIC